MVNECSLSRDEHAPPRSGAEKLLYTLRSNPTVSFLAIYGEQGLGEMLLTAKVREQHKELSSSFVRHSEIPQENTTIWHGAMKDFKKMQKVSGTDSVCVLLAVAWVTKDSVDTFSQFPEVLSSDATFKTNNEKRPLLHYSGYDSENQVFPAMWVFLPSQQP